MLATAVAAGCGDDDRSGGGDAGPGDGAVADADVPPACSGETELCGETCVDTMNDRSNCGGCGTACEAGEVCAGGSCSVLCPEGQAECDGSCVDTASDRRHCGECGSACGDGEICVEGSCELSCPASQVVCDASCVDTQSNPMHCGECGTACTAGQVCSEGACTTSCGAGLTECDGACVDTQNHPNNCGACGTECSGAAGASGLCMAGSCRIACNVLEGDCNADLGDSTGDGCETPLSTDPANCGACGFVCSAPSAIMGCSVGACTIAGCADGVGDCDGIVSNGCEQDLTSDDFSCGACGTVCASGERCIDSVCEAIVAEDCGSAVALTAGTNSVMWGAFVNDYLLTDPSCTTADVDGPDIVLSYTATTTGEHTFEITPPSSTRWVMVASTATCGTVDELACDSAYGSAISVDPYLASGETVYLYVADTNSGTNPLANPLSVDVTAPSCASPTAPAVTSVDPVDGSTTDTLTPVFEVTFDAPVYELSGTVSITGDRGTSLSYDLSTSPSEVSFDSGRMVMTIDPGITFPSAEDVTVTVSGMVGRTCGTAVTTHSWTITTICLEAFCATCTDGVMNGDETDVDCGGATSCPRCADGEMCTDASDCTSPYCEGGACGCATGYDDCDSDVTNGCETPVATDVTNCGGCGVTCAVGESCLGGTCGTQGTGEDCTSPWLLEPGANTVAWTASVADYLTSTPSCVAVGSVEGPDLVLTYTATTTGTHTIDFDKPSSTRWVAIVSTEACGTLSPRLACISEYAPTTMGGSFSLTAGETMYVYVRDTSSGSNPLDNPMTVTLTIP